MNWEEYINGIKKLQRKNRKVFFKKIFNINDVPNLNDSVLNNSMFKHESDDFLSVRDLMKNERKNFKKEHVIDLHGFTLNDAMEQLEKFIIEKAAIGISDIIVITGGSWKNNKTIRKSFLERVERELSAFISVVSCADRIDGGEGAFYVKIRKSMRTKK